MTGTGVVDAKSSPTDLVTQFDRASEQLITDELQRLRPRDGIIGEEGTSRIGESGVTWLVDPIDGTTNFFYNLAGYAVSIAAMDEHGALAGAVYLPVTDELFSAARGHGATLNGATIRCGSTSDLSQVLLATGFSYQRERRIPQAQRMVTVLGEIRDIRRLGAAAADLCFVAAGRVDAYFEENLGPWDCAAGLLIAAEAGCVCTDLNGDPARPAEILVTNAALGAPLRQLLNRGDTTRLASS